MAVSSKLPCVELRYGPATAAPRGSLHPFGSGQSSNPYASHYSMPFAFSAFSYPLHQQLSLRIACHLAMFREGGGGSGLPRSRFCRLECSRACPVSARLSHGSSFDDVSPRMKRTTGCTPFWSGPASRFGPLQVTRVSAVHICCTYGTCLAFTPHHG